MKKILFFFIFMINFFSSYALNFTIAPTSFEINLNKSETHEAYIINNTTTPLRIEVYVDIAKNYENKGLEKNITIFPKKVSVKPGARQIVRFRVKPSKDMQDGEYKSLLVFKEVPNEIKQKVDDKTSDEGIVANFSLITEIAIGVTGKK